MIYGLDDGSNLPIPNRERNNGGSLIVWSGHPQRAVLPPWNKPASEDDVDLMRKLESSQVSQTSQGYGPPLPPSPPSPPSSPPLLNPESGRDERRPSRSRLPTIILSVVLFLVIAALIVVSSILGTKIAKLESTVSPLAVAVAESAANGTTTNTNNNNNNNNNDNNTPSATTSSGLNYLNPSQTSANPPKTDSTQPPPAPLPPTIQVSGWTYLGCYYDSEVRVLPDAFLSDVNMTNAGCADYCSEDGKTPKHFGTQVAVQCYCGTATQAVLASRRAPDWMCMHQCGGRWGMTENCGGDWVLSLWERVGK